jgi:CheY-like chemotaxis protein
MKKLNIEQLCEISKDLKILYVEDDDFIMESMKTLLMDIFANVETASNGLEALQKMRNKKFDILLTDALMPQMDGIGLLIELRKENIDVRIGVISAMDDELTDEFRKLGIEELIAKPIDPPTLFCSLFRLCNQALQQN